MKRQDFYRIDHCADSKIVGHWEQVEDAKNITREELHRFEEFLHLEKFPDSIPCAERFRLHRRAKLTDVLSMKRVRLQTGLLISSDLRARLKPFRLDNTRDYPIAFDDKRLKLDYCLMYIIQASECVDYAQSVFQERDILLHPTGIEHRVDSLAALRALDAQIFEKNSGGIMPKSIVLNRKLDIIKFPLDNEIHVSEPMKVELEQGGNSGLLFERASEIEVWQ